MPIRRLRSYLVVPPTSWPLGSELNTLSLAGRKGTTGNIRYCQESLFRKLDLEGSHLLAPRFKKR